MVDPNYFALCLRYKNLCLCLIKSILLGGFWLIAAAASYLAEAENSYIAEAENIGTACTTGMCGFGLEGGGDATLRWIVTVTGTCRWFDISIIC